LPMRITPPSLWEVEFRAVPLGRDVKLAVHAVPLPR
jgi:hypothetical protein